MKKVRFIFLLSFILFLIPVTTVNADSWDYMPGGANYLNPDVFVIEDGWYKSIESFMIIPDQDFVLTMSDDYHRIFGGSDVLVQIRYYNNDVLLSEDELIFSDFTDFPSLYILSATLHSPISANKMQIEFVEADNYFLLNGLSEMMLEEGTVFTAFEAFIYGTRIDTSSPEFLNVNDVISYVHQPIAVNDIKASLEAFDTIDGDLSASIVVVEDNYTAMNAILGTYSITFNVSDLSGNTSEVIIDVHVVDVLKPVFSSVTKITLPYPQVMTISEIQALLNASDNYDGDITSEIILTEDNYSLNNLVVGDYSVGFEVSDSSNNTETVIVEIEVVDTESPVISGTTNVVIGYDETITTTQVLSQLQVIDNYDASLVFVIESNDYTDNQYLIGSYEIVVSVTDSSGNISFETVSIEVIDQIGPMIYFDYAIIQTYQTNVLSLEDFLDLLSLTNEFGNLENAKVEILYDSYTIHSDTPGVYHMKLLIEKVDSEIFEKDFQITVIDSEGVIYQPAVNETSFFEKNLQYLVIGALGIITLASNLVWFLYLKKR